MSRTDKDQREAKRDHWSSVFQPSWHNRMLRRSHRARARQDLRNGREPLPRYKNDRDYYW